LFFPACNRAAHYLREANRLATPRLVQFIHAGDIVGKLARLSALADQHLERSARRDLLRQRQPDKTPAGNHHIDGLLLLHVKTLHWPCCYLLNSRTVSKLPHHPAARAPRGAREPDVCTPFGMTADSL